MLSKIQENYFSKTQPIDVLKSFLRNPQRGYITVKDDHLIIVPVYISPSLNSWDIESLYDEIKNTFRSSEFALSVIDGKAREEELEQIVYWLLWQPSSERILGIGA